MYDTPPSRLTKIVSSILLLAGSILAYLFVVKIFISIWIRHTYLLPIFVALVAGALIYGGAKLWERWRIALGRIWLALCGLAFFNSFYDLKLAGLPDFPSMTLMGYSNGSLVMGFVAFTASASLIAWQRILDREDCAKSATLAN